MSDATLPKAESRPIRWYDLLTTQAVSFAASLLALLVLGIIWSMSGSGPDAVVERMTALQKDFYALNIILDAANIVLLFGCVWLMAGDPNLPARFGRLGSSHVLLGVGAGLAMFIVASAFEFGCDRLLGTSVVKSSSDMGILPRDMSQLALGVFTVAILAPMTEEAYFRGLLMGWLDRFGPIAATLISAMIFGLMHGKTFEPGGFEGTFITLELIAIGAALAVLARRTGSLWPAFLAHGANNLLATLFTVFFPNFGQ